MKKIISFYRSWILTFVPRACFLVALFVWVSAASAPAQEPEALATPAPETGQPLEPEQQNAPPPDPALLNVPPPPPEEGTSPSDSDQENTPPAALFVPEPEPEPLVEQPPQPEVAPFVPGESNAPRLEEDSSEIEVWRDESQNPEHPQVPPRQGQRFESTYVNGTDPVEVKLQFDPLAAGKTVLVRPGPGVTVEPPEVELVLGPNGEGSVSIQLDASLRRSEVNFYCDGIRSVMSVSRASLAVVEAREEETGGGE